MKNDFGNQPAFIYFLLGFSIGFVSFSMIWMHFIENSPIEYLDTETDQIEIDNYDDIDENGLELMQFRPLKVLCLITTSVRNHERKAVHVQQTWGKQCDKLIFVSTKTDTNLGAIGFNITDDHSHLWGKVKNALSYVYKNFIDEYDWIYKGDDDTFGIVENMRFLVSSYLSADPIYFGHRFKTKSHKYGYFSGGSGYLMSNTAVRLFVENILTNVSLCDVKMDKGSEDWNMGECLELAGVVPADSRDPTKRERFLPFNPKTHLIPSTSNPKFWYWQRSYYQTKNGPDCCSNYTIAFHYIKPKQMYILHYLTYHLNLYGIQRTFAPISKYSDFHMVVEAAEHDIKAHEKF